MSTRTRQFTDTWTIFNMLESTWPHVLFFICLILTFLPVSPLNGRGVKRVFLKWQQCHGLEHWFMSQQSVIFTLHHTSFLSLHTIVVMSHVRPFYTIPADLNFLEGSLNINSRNTLIRNFVLRDKILHRWRDTLRWLHLQDSLKVRIFGGELRNA